MTKPIISRNAPVLIEIIDFKVCQLVGVVKSTFHKKFRLKNISIRFHVPKTENVCNFQTSMLSDPFIYTTSRKSVRGYLHERGPGGEGDEGCPGACLAQVSRCFLDLSSCFIKCRGSGVRTNARVSLPKVGETNSSDWSGLLPSQVVSSEAI